MTQTHTARCEARLSAQMAGPSSPPGGTKGASQPLLLFWREEWSLPSASASLAGS